jgi:hypothetical protein
MDYRRRLHGPVLKPAWAAVAGLPEKSRRRVLSRLLDAARAAPAQKGFGWGVSSDEVKIRRLDRIFAGCPPMKRK